MTCCLVDTGGVLSESIDQYPSIGLEKWTTNFWPSSLITQQPGDPEYRTLILEIDKKKIIIKR